jgi:hypothetical protein
MNEKIEVLGRSILAGPAHTNEAERKRVADYCAALAADPTAPNPFDGPLATWIDKVARHAYRTLDREAQALLDEGRSEDEVFELTVAAAYGSARGRYDRALTAIDEAFDA